MLKDVLFFGIYDYVFFYGWNNILNVILIKDFKMRLWCVYLGKFKFFISFFKRWEFFLVEFKIRRYIGSFENRERELRGEVCKNNLVKYGKGKEEDCF